MKAVGHLVGCTLILAASCLLTPLETSAQETRNPGQPPAAASAEQHKEGDKEIPFRRKSLRSLTTTCTRRQDAEVRRDRWNAHQFAMKTISPAGDVPYGPHAGWG